MSNPTLHFFEIPATDLGYFIKIYITSLWDFCDTNDQCFIQIKVKKLMKIIFSV